VSANSDGKWHQKNDIGKGHRKMASENVVGKQCWKKHQKMALENGIVRCLWKTSKNGVIKWHWKWLLKRGWIKFYNVNL
jgi:hypothetical protein